MSAAATRLTYSLRKSKARTFGRAVRLNFFDNGYHSHLLFSSGLAARRAANYVARKHAMIVAVPSAIDPTSESRVQCGP